jgi:hypothetical protein
VIKPVPITVAWIQRGGSLYFLGSVPEGTDSKEVDITECYPKNNMNYEQACKNVHVGSFMDLLIEKFKAEDY